MSHTCPYCHDLDEGGEIDDVVEYVTWQHADVVETLVQRELERLKRDES